MESGLRARASEARAIRARWRVGKSKRRVTSKNSHFHHHHPNFYDLFPKAIASFTGTFVSGAKSVKRRQTSLRGYESAARCLYRHHVHFHQGYGGRKRWRLRTSNHGPSASLAKLAKCDSTSFRAG